MTFPAQQQPDLIQADELTLSNIIDRLRTLAPGQAIEYHQTRHQAFPTSGRYEPNYHAEMLAMAVRLSVELHNVTMRAYYDLCREVIGDRVDALLAENNGALAVLQLLRLIRTWNARGSISDHVLPILQIDTRMTVLGPEFRFGQIEYHARGGVIVRRLQG